jgi:hypothetical protein
MTADSTVRPGATLDTVRRRRAELRQAVQDLADAVASNLAPAAWRTAVASRLSALRERLAQHVGVTEGPGGLYAELLEHAPRLSRQVESLTDEHRSLETAVNSLARRLRDPSRPVPRLRRIADELLADLGAHRQRGADLIYEAYATDIGGET